MAGITQDWEPVVLRKKAPTAAARKDEKAVNAARRSGAEIETIRKGIIVLECFVFFNFFSFSYVFYGCRYGLLISSRVLID